MKMRPRCESQTEHTKSFYASWDTCFGSWEAEDVWINHYGMELAMQKRAQAPFGWLTLCIANYLSCLAFLRSLALARLRSRKANINIYVFKHVPLYMTNNVTHCTVSSFRIFRLSFLAIFDRIKRPARNTSDWMQAVKMRLWFAQLENRKTGWKEQSPDISQMDAHI